MVDANLHPVHDTSDGSPEPGIALCLSGGGYRAMLFHAGCLWRLNQLGLLGKLNRVSSVSGGSIIAGVLGMNWKDLDIQPNAESRRFEDLLIGPIRQAASTTIDEGAIFGGIFLPGTISDHVAGKYDSLLFHGRQCRTCPTNRVCDQCHQCSIRRPDANFETVYAGLPRRSDSEAEAAAGACGCSVFCVPSGALAVRNQGYRLRDEVRASHRW